jgi:adenine deaminase
MKQEWSARKGLHGPWIGKNAEQWGLKQRGTLVPGHHADLVLFDLDAVCLPITIVAGGDTVILHCHRLSIFY